MSDWCGTPHGSSRFHKTRIDQDLLNLPHDLVRTAMQYGHDHMVVLHDENGHDHMAVLFGENGNDHTAVLCDVIWSCCMDMTFTSQRASRRIVCTDLVRVCVRFLCQQRGTALGWFNWRQCPWVGRFWPQGAWLCFGMLLRPCLCVWQVLFSNGVALLWNVYMSFILHKDDDRNESAMS